MMEEGMQHALEEAELAVSLNHGGPFGAAILKNGKLIAKAHNTVILDKNPVCHAEINAISLAAKKLNTHVLDECEIFTTAQPCLMCYAAIYWARIKKLHFGVDSDYVAKFGFDDVEMYRQIQIPKHEQKIIQIEGVLAEKSKKIFNKWKNLNRDLY